MELDELKLAWQSLDRRLERQSAMQASLLREYQVEKAVSKLRPLRIGQVVQILAGVAFCVVFAPFWVAHWRTPSLLLSGLLLHAYGIMLIVTAARVVYFISRIDYAAPVLAIQRQLAELHAWRVYVEAPLYGVTGCFIWIPLMIALFGMAGVDIWRHLPSLIWYSLASSFACLAILLAVYALHDRWKHNPAHAAWVKRALNSAAGRSLVGAQQALDRIAGFERE